MRGAGTLQRASTHAPWYLKGSWAQAEPESRPSQPRLQTFLLPEPLLPTAGERQTCAKPRTKDAQYLQPGSLPLCSACPGEGNPRWALLPAATPRESQGGGRQPHRAPTRRGPAAPPLPARHLPARSPRRGRSASFSSPPTSDTPGLAFTRRCPASLRPRASPPRLGTRNRHPGPSPEPRSPAAPPLSPPPHPGGKRCSEAIEAAVGEAPGSSASGPGTGRERRGRGAEWYAGVLRGAEEGAGMCLAVQGVRWGAGRAFVGLGHPEQFWSARGIGTGCISRGRMAHTEGAWEELCGMWRGCLRDLQGCVDVHGVCKCRLWGALSGMQRALPPRLTPRTWCTSLGCPDLWRGGWFDKQLTANCIKC